MLPDAAPDFAAPLEAWRAWRVVERVGLLWLASVVKRTVWRAGEPLVAECFAGRRLQDWMRRRPHHSAPSDRCECGIYATSLERVTEYLDDTFPDAVARVFGRVALWGEVVECERGYRASHAYPLLLYVPAGWKNGSRTVRDDVAAGLERYGVPVELVPGIDGVDGRLRRGAAA